MVDARPALRASDDERDAVATALREHYAVGRLTTEELGDRLEAVYAARTQPELAAVTVDLPALEGATPAPARPRSRRARRRREPRGWGGYLRVNGICWSIRGVTVVTSGAHTAQGWWPLWVSVPWGVLMLAGRGRGPADPGAGQEPGGGQTERQDRSSRV